MTLFFEMFFFKPEETSESDSAFAFYKDLIL